MGNLRSHIKKLDAQKVWFAQEVTKKKTELVKTFVSERAKEDQEFARDILKHVGEALPEEIRQVAENTVKNGPTQKVEKETTPKVNKSIPAVKGKLQVASKNTNSGRIYQPKMP